MLKVEVDGVRYRIEWEHFNKLEGMQFGMGWGIRGTSCAIYEEDLRFSSYCGVAQLHPHDRFNKEVGRKVSLARALEKWSKEQRKIVWAAYFGRKGGAE